MADGAHAQAPPPRSAAERRRMYAVMVGQCPAPFTGSAAAAAQKGGEARPARGGRADAPAPRRLTQREEEALNRMVEGKAARPLNTEYSAEARRVMANARRSAASAEMAAPRDAGEALARRNEYEHLRRSAMPPLPAPTTAPHEKLPVHQSASARLSLGLCARVYNQKDLFDGAAAAKRRRPQSTPAPDLASSLDAAAAADPPPEEAVEAVRIAGSKPLFDGALARALAEADAAVPRTQTAAFVDAAEWHMNAVHEATRARSTADVGLRLAAARREVCAARMLALSEVAGAPGRLGLEGSGAGAVAVVRAHARLAIAYAHLPDEGIPEAVLAHCTNANGAADAARHSLPRFANARASLACWQAHACVVAASVFLKDGDAGMALGWLARAEQNYTAAGEALNDESGDGGEEVNVMGLARFGLVADVAGCASSEGKHPTGSLDAATRVAKSLVGGEDEAPDIARAVDARWLRRWQGGEEVDGADVEALVEEESEDLLPFRPAILRLLQARAYLAHGTTHGSAAAVAALERAFAISGLDTSSPEHLPVDGRLAEAYGMMARGLEDIGEAERAHALWGVVLESGERGEARLRGLLARAGEDEAKWQDLASEALKLGGSAVAKEVLLRCGERFASCAQFDEVEGCVKQLCGKREAAAVRAAALRLMGDAHVAREELVQAAKLYASALDVAEDAKADKEAAKRLVKVLNFAKDRAASMAREVAVCKAAERPAKVEEAHRRENEVKDVARYAVRAAVVPSVASLAVHSAVL